MTTREPAMDVADLGNLFIGVDHMAIAVKDLREAIRWYVALGFTLVETRHTEGEATSMNSAVVKAGSIVLVLLEGTSPESQICRFIENFGPGVQHVAFRVTDLDAALELVIKAGGGIDTPLIVDAGIRQAFLRRDPGSGVRVELIEKRGGDFSDASVRELFLAFERLDLY